MTLPINTPTARGPVHPLTGELRSEQDVDRQLRLIRLNPSITLRWARTRCPVCAYDQTIGNLPSCAWCGADRI